MKKIFSLAVFIFIFSCAFAETVVLKSGKTVTGKITERTSAYIKVQIMDDLVSTYFLDQIQSIDGKSIGPQEPEKAQVQEATKKEAPGAPTTEKAQLLEKMKAASKNINRTISEEIDDVDMHDFMHVKTKKTMDVDFSSGIVEVRSEVIDYSLDMDKVIESAKNQIIAKAKKEGKSEAEIKSMTATADQNSSKLKSVSDAMVDRIKKTKTVMLMTRDAFYLNYNGTWYKVASYPIKEFWQAFDKVKTGDTQGAIQGISDLASAPESQKKAFTDGLQALLQSRQEDNNIKSIKETVFSGVPCYELDVNMSEVADYVKDSFLSYADNKKAKDVDVDFGLFSSQILVSKETYLPLANRQNVEMTMSATSASMGKSFKSFMKSETLFTYPKDKAVLPAGLDKAKIVQNEDELKQIIMKDIPGSQGALSR